MQHFRILIIFIFPLTLFAQLPKPENGVADAKTNSYAITHVTVLMSPTKTITDGTVIVRNGKIEDVGVGLSAPKDLREIDGTGKTLIPAFIELQSSIGIPDAKRKEFSFEPQIESKKQGPYYWNESIHPEIDPTDWYKIDESAIDEMHKMGFGLAVTHQNDGIVQGTGTLFALGKSDLKEIYIKPEVATYFSFRKGVSQQEYPSSQMGSIALLRQTLYDAQWHNLYGKTPNYSLEALTKQEKLPSIFFTSGTYELLRVHAISKEFNRKFTIVGTGHEYELGKIWDTLPHQFIIPINFPSAYELKDPYIARQIPFSDLKHWELAPSNPAFLMNNKVKFAITSMGHKSAADFWKNLHKSFELGWTPEDALRALTIAPAELLGVQAEFGTIEKGKWASFNLYDSNPFLFDAKLLETFVQGNRLVKAELNEADIRGKYSFNIDGTRYNLEIKGSSAQKLDAQVQFIRTIKDTATGKDKADTLKMDAYINYLENDLTLQFLQKDQSIIQNFSLKGVMNTRVFIAEGDGTNGKGKWIKWNAIRNSANEEKDKTKPSWTIDSSFNSKPVYPNLAFGFDSVPQTQTIIFENATVWTNEADGIIENATVIVENGKIKTIQKGAGTYTIPKGAKVINAKGKHLTSGIIDEHSHVAISNGVNEGGQAVSAEVRIGDVIDAGDINVYRQLSGGVTAAQLLHGSANPVGGQSALIKLKWGHLPNDYLIKNAPKFVKFALGENVKQANWGDFNTVRFPQTRMGVEQVYIDGFSRALAYHAEMEAYKTKSAGKQKDKTINVPPARDLELDAMYEIVKGERKISCHSYVQSEINMLMHVADSFGFTVNTFTHILEGYKVADKMKAHGAGASTFSDWWAYKYEVKEAIPFNASLMNQVGVVVAINSDDAEMGRRLNQEAGKVVKYGGVTEIEAWKMVTLNPAKLLHLEDKMGSVKVGKDADLVLWSDNPLSINAKSLYTIVDGEILFDREADLLMQQKMDEERARIITKMTDTSKKGESTKPFIKKRRGQYHCNTVGEEMSTEENEH